MSSALIWPTVALGLGVLVVRRRSALIGLVTLQTLLLVVLALTADEPLADRLGAAGALAFRAVALAIAFLWLLRRLPHRRTCHSYSRAVPPLVAGTNRPIESHRVCRP